MKKATTIFLLLLSSFAGFSKNYYVSSSGSDAANGLTPGTAWKTSTKVNQMLTSMAAGDSILLNRGDTIYGGYIITRGNLNFGAYGTGAKPVIMGLSTVTGWVSLGNNLWEAPVSNVKPDVNLVLRNSAIQQVGRFPNANAANGGYLTYTTANTTSITGVISPTPTNWTGAELAIRMNRYTIRRQIITGHSGNTFTFAYNKDIPRTGYGYFIQRDSRTLDIEGEWWYDAANKKLRVFSALNPSVYNYQISTVDTLLGNNTYQNNITVSDLQFIGAGKKAIWMYSGANHVVKNCNVKFSGAEAIRFSFNSNIVVTNNTISNSLGSGIKLAQDAADPVQLTVVGNTVDSTAFIAGMDISDNVDNGGHGISIKGNKGTIEYNTVTNSGYCGIEWQGNDFRIRYNLVRRFCFVKDDGAGIYTYESNDTTKYLVRYNRRIISNIVLDAIGANAGAVFEGAESGYSGRCIYFDEGTTNVICDSNTLANAIGLAFHGNNNQSLWIRNNTIYNCRGGFSFQRLQNGKLIRGLYIVKNAVFPYLFEYRNLAINLPTLANVFSEVGAAGTIDSNYIQLKRSTGDTSLTTVVTYNDLTNYKATYSSFASMKSATGKEINTIQRLQAASLEYNASSIARVVNFPGLAKMTPDGTIYNNSFTLPPWGGAVLLDTTYTPPPTPTPPPVALVLQGVIFR